MTTKKEVAAQEAEPKDLKVMMAGETEKRQLLKEFIAHHMVSGTDYGTIKFGGKESKPSLFKPGSEKFLSLFKLTAKFEKDTDTWEMAGSEKGVFAYKCTLHARNSEVVGEGRGVSKLTEKVGWTINNAVKIAEKRAQIDAVLRTGALSDFFTQDLEDMSQATAAAYDQSPIADNAVPTVTYDNPEESKPTAPWRAKDSKVNAVNSLKRQIKEIADKTVMVPLEGKKDYEDWVFEMTTLDLSDQTEENLRNILERLQTLTPKHEEG